jgi:hypothetical protein
VISLVASAEMASAPPATHWSPAPVSTCPQVESCEHDRIQAEPDRPGGERSVAQPGGLLDRRGESGEHGDGRGNPVQAKRGPRFGVQARAIPDQP